MVENHTDGSGGPESQSGENDSGTPQSASRTRTYFIVAIPVLLGLFSGLGTFTFGYGKGASYLSKDPQSCANCHVMQDHFDSWQKSSHHHAAACNDCHLPHDFVGKWVTKADNGFFHSLAFTLQDYHDPIQIKPRNKRVTQDACIHCHKDFVHSLLPAAKPNGEPVENDMLSCVHCHADVGHAFRAISSSSKRD